jgi:hypothetical protein
MQQPAHTLYGAAMPIYVSCLLMEFKLSFTPAKPQQKVGHNTPLLLTGSCFSEHVAALLQQHAFSVVSQPNGVVFNPVSIAQHLQRIINSEIYKEEELFFNNELWHSWHHHSSFSGTDKNSVLDMMNNRLGEAHHQVMQPGCMIMVTPGTGYVYEVNERKQIVANCHKYPQQQFAKRLLSPEEIVAEFSPVIEQLKETAFCFTVSPVRHVRDGLVENNLGKAVLLQAVHELCRRYKTCYYFPAYEIIIDELRDYRFYNSDMVHPSQQAIAYVWQQFTETCLSDGAKELVKDMTTLNAMLHHKILHKHTEAHTKFIEAKENKIKEVEQKYGIEVKKR